MKVHTRGVAAALRMLVAVLCLTSVMATQLGVVVSALSHDAVHDCECLPEMCHCRHDSVASCHREADTQDWQGCTEKGDQLFAMAWDTPPAFETIQVVEIGSPVRGPALCSAPTVDVDVDPLPPRLEI